MEKLISAWIIVTGVVLFIYIILVSLLVRRTLKVSDFRLTIINLCDQYNRRHFSWKHKPEESAYHWFLTKGPSSFKMILSRKPLTLENWYPKELIEKLKYGQNDTDY